MNLHKIESAAVFWFIAQPATSVVAQVSKTVLVNTNICPLEWMLLLKPSILHFCALCHEFLVWRKRLKHHGTFFAL